MEKEAEAVEERIKVLEENQLEIAKEFGKQNIAFFLTLAGIKVSALKEDKYKYYEKYMKFKMEEANRYIGGAKDVEEVISLTNKYNDECIIYSESLLSK